MIRIQDAENQVAELHSGFGITKKSSDTKLNFMYFSIAHREFTDFVSSVIRFGGF